MLQMRDQTIGIMPLLAFAEYADNLDIPETVFEHATIKEIVKVTIQACSLYVLHLQIL